MRGGEGEEGKPCCFKPHSWQRGQSGLNYQTISDGLILATMLHNGAPCLIERPVETN